MPRFYVMIDQLPWSVNSPGLWTHCCFPSFSSYLQPFLSHMNRKSSKQNARIFCSENIKLTVLVSGKSKWKDLAAVYGRGTAVRSELPDGWPSSFLVPRAQSTPTRRDQQTERASPERILSYILPLLCPDRACFLAFLPSSFRAERPRLSACTQRDHPSAKLQVPQVSHPHNGAPTPSAPVRNA